MFSVLYYLDSDIYSVKFYISDDWFEDRNKRISTFAINNQDYIVELFNYLNYKLPAFTFCLEDEKLDDEKSTFT